MTELPPQLPGLPSDAPPRRPAALWVELVVAMAAVVFLGLLGLGFVLNATGATHGAHNASRGGQIAGALVSLGLLVLAGRWAVHVEHRLRRHQPVAQAWMSSTAAAALAAPAAPAAAPRRAPRRYGRVGGRRGYGPNGTRLMMGVFALAAAGCIAGAVSTYEQAQRSSYVQAHGTPASGTVSYVDNTQHCGRYSCSYTAAVTVTLIPPVDGVPATTIHYPGFSSLVTGEPTNLLVDPKQPDYAELPGVRFKSTSSWIMLAGMALLCLFLVWVEWKALQKMLEHRRAMVSAAPAQVGAAAR